MDKPIGGTKTEELTAKNINVNYAAARVAARRHERLHPRGAPRCDTA